MLFAVYNKCEYSYQKIQNNENKDKNMIIIIKNKYELKMKFAIQPLSIQS